MSDVSTGDSPGCRPPTGLMRSAHVVFLALLVVPGLAIAESASLQRDTADATITRNDFRELSRSVDALRHRWVEVTDVGAQFRKHKGKLIAGAVVAGFVIGGALALRRR